MTTPATPPPPAPVPPELPEGYHIIPKDWLRTNLLPADAIFTFNGRPWRPSNLQGFQLQSWEIDTYGRFYATRAPLPPAEPTASESSGDVHFAGALAEIERLKAELEQSSEIINLNISTEFRLRNELDAALTERDEAKAISQKHGERTKELARQLEQRGIDLDTAIARNKVLEAAVTEALNRHYRITNGDDDPVTQEEKDYAHRLETALATSSPAPVADNCDFCENTRLIFAGAGYIQCQYCRPVSPVAVGAKDSAGPTPFNLKRALAGDPVVTRDGRTATGLTFDKQQWPVRGTVDKIVRRWTQQGEYYAAHEPCSLDLFMLTPPVAGEGGKG
jgi:hypothetical protein